MATAKKTLINLATKASLTKKEILKLANQRYNRCPTYLIPAEPVAFREVTIERDHKKMLFFQVQIDQQYSTGYFKIHL